MDNEAIIMYQVGYMCLEIKPVQVERFTEKSVWVDNGFKTVREKRENAHKPYFETFDEAKAHCVNHWQAKVSKYEKWTNDAYGYLADACRLEPPKETTND